MRSKSNFKTAVIGFSALIVSTLLWVGWKNYDRSTHYIKTVGSCNQPTTIKIYDETGGVDPAGIMNYDQWGGYTYSSRPVNTIENKHFKNYVTTISKYVFAKVDAMGLCQAASGKPQVDLVFVYRPAISRGIKPFVFQPQKYPDTQQLDSPWVKLSLDKSPQLNLRAVFIWNERQFLLDRAFIKAGRVSDTNIPMPVELETFNRWEKDYDADISGEKLNFAKQLPEDILWIFNRRVPCVGLTGIREKAIDRLQTIAKEEKIGYIDLTKIILNQFFAEPRTESRYNSILDLKKVFNIDKY